MPSHNGSKSFRWIIGGEQAFLLTGCGTRSPLPGTSLQLHTRNLENLAATQQPARYFKLLNIISLEDLTVYRRNNWIAVRVAAVAHDALCVAPSQANQRAVVTSWGFAFHCGAVLLRN
jgi:hypothetical protein